LPRETAGYDAAMGSLLGFGSPGRRVSRPGASFGLVTELVEREVARAPREAPAPHGRMGVIRIGERATVCRVEHVPAVGDLVHGDVTGIVDRVRIAHDGRVSIFATPVLAPEP
jgi:hypothetical protein